MNPSHRNERRSWRRLVFWAACLLGLVLPPAAWPLAWPDGQASEATAAPVDARTRQRVQDQYGKLPLSFIQNQGQAPAPIAWYVQRPGLNIAFMPQGQRLVLNQGQGEDARVQRLDIDLVGAAPRAIDTLIAAEGIVSYFKGPKEHWKTGIPTAEAIVYRDAWTGIDVQYRGTGGQLESFYVVAPGADPDQIRLRYRGQDRLALADNGDLVLSVPGGELRETAPVLYQETDGQRVAVAGRYRLLADGGVGFEIAAYDRARPLIIDPVLVYAGYIGGTAGEDGNGIAVDSDGNAYVTGNTSSDENTFPDTVGPDLTHNGSLDAFVAKVNAAGTALVYAGYIGGAGNDFGRGIAVDSAGNAYVTGETQSNEASFPVTIGALDTTHNGGADAFVAKVNPAGTALVYAGYIGGAGSDVGRGIAVDAAGNAYVTGNTLSTEASFPVSGGPDLTHNGNSDAFVAKVNAAGTALVYAGYIGGASGDFGQGIALDSTNNAYVTGYTTSTEATFPVTVGPDLTYNDSGGFNTDAFVTKVNAAGTALIYAGYVGGAGIDQGLGIAVDGANNAYLTGYTNSTQTSFPVTVGPDLTHNGGFDAFVAKVSAGGASLVYAGYIGGANDDFGNGIAVSGAGSAYVAGYTGSTETSFPVLNGPDLSYNGNLDDAFVAQINPAGSALIYAGYIGGTDRDQGHGIAVDSAGNAYVIGGTASTEASFPVLNGPDLSYNTGFDAFVAKIGPSTADLAITKTDGVTTAVPGNSVIYTLTVTNTGPDAVNGATVADTFPASLTCTWTCVGAGGGTCTAAGSGNLNDTVNLPVGGSVAYTASCNISPSATGSLANTATVAAPGGVTDPTPGNNSATDTDTLTPQADLSITKTDGVTTAAPGGSTTYTIVASNAGPSTATGVTVSDTFPASLTGCSTTAVVAGGASGHDPGPTAGNLNDTGITLPPGASVTYTATCTVDVSATGTLSNTATITATTTDSNAGNNSATDTDTLAPAVTSFTGPTATGTGNATATVTGGGNACGFVPTPQFVAVASVPAPPPAGYTFPHGLFSFTLANCNPGETVTLTITYPAAPALPPGTLYWKYGPTPGQPTPHWYMLSATIGGNTASFSITDGGLGDDDLSANRTIVDQGGPGVPGAGDGTTGIPTLHEWALLLLSALFGGLLWRARRRFG
ncbi:MAG: IPTL-CTERM sorting domain-containing protein [Candidatus Contendobacter sp.]|nr:IPTL-CTERM sorting domain-containing protein [Candidatus Contendobacter sp.]